MISVLVASFMPSSDCNSEEMTGIKGERGATKGAS